mmetsp:Transcript_110353/g.276282  ORF Transcript_110353/g.276282 Transcript_110353/m.276282 type:complete len:150 (+) Transcript_110353:84-533(+)
MPSFLNEPMNTIVSKTIAKELANQSDPSLAERRSQLLFHLYMGHVPPKYGTQREFKRREFQEPGLFVPTRALQTRVPTATGAETMILDQGSGHAGSSRPGTSLSRSLSCPGSQRPSSSASSVPQQKERPPGGTFSEWVEWEKRFPIKKR